KTEGDKQLNAYRATAELDKRELDARAGDKPDTKTAEDVTKKKDDLELWIGDSENDLPKTIGRLTVQSDGWVEELKQKLKPAGREYHKGIEAWAKTRLDKEKSFWQKLVEAVRDWFRDSEQKKKDWEETSITDNNTTLANDELVLDTMILNDTGI